MNQETKAAASLTVMNQFLSSLPDQKDGMRITHSLSNMKNVIILITEQLKHLPTATEEQTTLSTQARTLAEQMLRELDYISTHLIIAKMNTGHGSIPTTFGVAV